MDDVLAPLSKTFEVADLLYVVPIGILATFGMVVLGMDLYLTNKSKVPLAIVTAMACGLAAVAALATWTGAEEQVVLSGTLVISAGSAALSLPILIAATFIGLAVVHHGTHAPALGTPHGLAPHAGAHGAAGGGEAGAAPTRSNSIAHGEFYALILFAASAMLALIVANDLVTFFVAIETLSLAAYAMTGLDRRRPRSAEGAMKYFLMGAFAAAFLLYGFSLIYGATHTLRLDEIATVLVQPGAHHLAATGGALVMIGLLFKVGAIPFHAWAPDAYEGAPSAAAGFMAVGVKVAAIAGTLRVVAALGASGALGSSGVWALWLIAAITVIAGNAAALTQINPRRLLAYSAIAHTGYLLVGLVAIGRTFDASHPGAGADLLIAGRDAAGGVIFYVLAYAIANLAAFGVLVHLERNGEDVDRVEDLSGLARSQPGAALVMTLAMLSLAGIPGTVGFLGKLWVFRAGVAAGDIGLVVLALAASAVSLYYYLRVVVVMYMQPPHPGTAGALPADPRRWCSRLAIGAAGILIVLLGVYPTQWLLNLVIDGAHAMF